MSIIKKLVLLAGLALAALAFTASTAAAQESEVEVVEELGHVPCVDCPIHAEGEALLSTGTGIPLSLCHDEFEGEINHDGTGEIRWTGRNHGTPDCTVTNCAAPEDHWEVYDLGELPSGEEHITVDFCLHSNAANVDIHCPGHEVHIEDESLHHYILSLTGEVCQTVIGPIVIDGEWEIEADEDHPALELEHHDA